MYPIADVSLSGFGEIKTVESEKMYRFFAPVLYSLAVRLRLRGGVGCRMVEI